MKRHIFTYTLYIFLLFLSQMTTVQAQQILQNTGFESGLHPWVSYGEGQITSSNPHSGSNLIQICGSAGDDRVLQTVAATAGKSYTLKFWGRWTASGSFNPGYGYLKFLSSSWQPLGLHDQYIGFGASSWTEYSRTVTAPSGTAYVEVGVDNYSGSACVFFDDVTLTEGSGGGGNCSITASISNVQCNDNGTANDPNDDTYTVSATVNKSGNCGNIWTSGAYSGQYGVAKTMGPYPISGGNKVLTFQDGQSGASTTATAVAPATCSGGGTGGGCVNSLLVNGNFSSSLNSWSQSGSGISWVTGADAVLGRAASICNNGSRIYQTLFVNAGTSYTFEGQVKRNQNAQGLMTIKYMDASWTPIGQEFHATTSNNFQLESMTLVAPSGTVRGEVSFYKNSGSGCVFADDFCFGETGGGGGDCAPDITSPVLSNCPTDQSVSTNGSNAIVTWSEPTVTDNCTPNITPTVNLPSGSAFSIGTTTVTYQAVDASFNASTCSFNVTVTSTNTGSGCGFDKINANADINRYSESASNLGNGGFKIAGRNSGNYVELSLSATGNQTNFTTEQVTGNKTRTSDGYYVAASFTDPNTIQLIKSNGTGGNVQFTKNIAFQSGQSNYYQGPFARGVVEVSDGFLIAGYFDYQDPPNSTPKQTFFIVKTDLNGNKQYQTLLPLSSSYPAYFDNFIAGPSGNSYLVIQDNGSLDLYKFNTAGTNLWMQGILSDFPSSDFIDMHEASDGGFLVARYDNQFGYVRKLNGNTGAELWDFSSANLPIPNNSIIMGRPYGSLPTSDGGAVFSMRYWEPTNSTNTGTVFGRLSGTGNLQWSTLHDESFEYRPVLMTSDGGALWIGKKGTQDGVIKTTSLGELTPTCTGGGGNQPDLTVSNLNLGASSIQKGQVLSFNFDLQNIGNALANGNFTIKSYISTDQTLSGNDIQDGTIPTGFLGAGQTIPQTGGALTVPSNLANGQYYIILQVDADNQITESNENNNVTVSAGQITVTGGGGGGADLEVTMTANKTTVSQWGNVTYTVTAKNNGSSTINSATIDVGVCGTGQGHGFNGSNELVYAGLPPAPTKGSYNFATQLWQLSNLAAGQTGVLTLNLFTTGTSERKVVAWTTAQSPNDPDSQPSTSPANMINGNCTPSQDDEALWTINSGQAFVQGTVQEEVYDAPVSAIFPNPASRYMNLDLSGFEGKNVDLSMINAYGQVILQKQNLSSATETVGLDAVPNGQYMVQLRAENMRPVVVRVVVEKGQ